jgi:biopolymer transport protein ExbD
MGIGIAGNQRGILCEANIVPLIDILLVLLVIFMIIPHRQMGLQADLPHQASPPVVVAPAEAIVVQIFSDGSPRINRLLVKREELRDRLERILAPRARRVAFLRADGSLEFQAVAQVLDGMHAAGASSVGLLTSELEKNR